MMQVVLSVVARCGRVRILAGILGILLVAALAGGCAALPWMHCDGYRGGSASAENHAKAVWWKGNLHSHTMRSDGDEFPEMVADWYKRHGYGFLAVTDHSSPFSYERDTSTTLLFDALRVSTDTLTACTTRFGKDWVEYKMDGDKKKIVLKSLEEYRGKVEQPGRFLLLPGEEISMWGGEAKEPVHVNAINNPQVIRAPEGATTAEMLDKALAAVGEMRKASGRLVLAQVNHPNFFYALTAEDIAPLDGAHFVEIYNGTGVTADEGDALHTDCERIWDIVLTKRLAELGKGPLWGTAVDDAHYYKYFDRKRSNPGRGWVMVRAKDLTAKDITAALEKGDFYCSTGVELSDVRFNGRTVRMEIVPKQGATYRTQFIGTRKGYDPKSEAVTDAKGKELATTRRYSKDVGAVLAESEGLKPSYTLRGDEVYVRARVISSEGHPNPVRKEEKEMAWTQPFVGGK